MCCFFNNGCNAQNRRMPVRVITAQGPRGPQGPQGIAGTNDVLYAVNTGGTVATNTIIPLTLSAITDGSTQSLINNSVNLPTAGTYLVSYFVNGSVATGNLSASLYLNGAAIPNESIVMTNVANASSAGSRTALIRVNAPSTLSLYNTSTDTATLSGASLNVLKTA